MTGGRFGSTGGRWSSQRETGPVRHDLVRRTGPPRRLSLKREHYLIEARMSFTERLIAFEPAAVAKTSDDSLCGLRALTLGIVDNPRSIAAPMNARGNPPGRGLREFCRFSEKFDECLLPSLWNSKDVNLRDDTVVSVDDRHVQLSSSGLGGTA